MRKTILLSFFILILSKSYGQSDFYDIIGIDSIYIEYRSFCEFTIDVIKVTQDSITFYEKKSYDNDMVTHKKLYQIKNNKKIRDYYSILKIILNTDPTYNKDNAIIDDCIPSMVFKFFVKGTVIEKWYELYASANFPFEYTLLYHEIFTILNKKNES